MGKGRAVVDREGLRVQRYSLGPYSTNAYLLICKKTGESVLIDAPAEAETIMKALEGTKPRYILLTHTHLDHIGALAELRSLKIPLAAHAAERPNLSSPPEFFLEDGEKICFGQQELKVLHTPGHTKGSLSFYLEGFLFSGDTLFPGGPGKTVSPAALKEIIASITRQLFTLPDHTRVFPGHGEDTVLKKEKEAYKIFASSPHDPNLCGDVTWLSD